MLYAAYGSNLNIDQMLSRCPDATIAGAGYILNYRLIFRNVADIEPAPGFRVPVGLWHISEEDEQSLDAHEGAPTLYRQQSFLVLADDAVVFAMAYLMNETGYSPPSNDYLKTVQEGYADFDLMRYYLDTAVSASRLVPLDFPASTARERPGTASLLR